MCPGEPVRSRLQSRHRSDDNGKSFACWTCFVADAGHACICMRRTHFRQISPTIRRCFIRLWSAVFDEWVRRQLFIAYDSGYSCRHLHNYRYWQCECGTFVNYIDARGSVGMSFPQSSMQVVATNSDSQSIRVSMQRVITLKKMQSNIARMLAVSVTATLGACSGTTSDAIPPTCNSTSSASEHLYVVNGTGELRQFVLPLTSTSIPSVDFFDSIKHDAVAVDSNGNIATADITEGGVTVYDAPISCLSKASATFSDTTRRGDLVFNAAGDLFAIGQYEIDLYKPPFSSATSVSQTVDSITPGGLYGVSFVGGSYGRQRKFVQQCPCSGSRKQNPGLWTASSSETGASPLLDYLQDIAVSKARLFTRQDTGVAVFDLPITESSEASFIIPLRPPCEGKDLQWIATGISTSAAPQAGRSSSLHRRSPLQVRRRLL
jgi:hypothetical protein